MNNLKTCLADPGPFPSSAGQPPAGPVSLALSSRESLSFPRSQAPTDRENDRAKRSQSNFPGFPRVSHKQLGKGHICTFRVEPAHRLKVGRDQPDEKRDGNYQNLGHSAPGVGDMS